MIYYGIIWYIRVYHGISWYIMVYYGILWCTPLLWYIKGYIPLITEGISDRILGIRRYTDGISEYHPYTSVYLCILPYTFLLKKFFLIKILFTKNLLKFFIKPHFFFNHYFIDFWRLRKEYIPLALGTI